MAAAALAGCGGSPRSSSNEPLVGDIVDVPVGGGMVLDGRVVVTQPSPGVYAAFSATCTHQGCTVSEIEDGTINCPCHGSAFGITDGSVVQGPAREPLPRRQVTVEGTSFTVA